MTRIARRTLAAVVLAAALTSAAAIPPARGQAAAFTAPPLAAGVQPATDWTAPATAYVVANGTPLYRAPVYDPAQQTGESLQRGEQPQVLAEANQGLYLLIGRNGRGVGYAPKALLCPASVCRDLKG